MNVNNSITQIYKFYILKKIKLLETTNIEMKCLIPRKKHIDKLKKN